MLKNLFICFYFIVSHPKHRDIFKICQKLYSNNDSIINNNLKVPFII